MNLAEWIAEGWKNDLGCKCECHNSKRVSCTMCAEHHKDEEGICRGCGLVEINNADDELCAECTMEKLADQSDKWGEQIEVEALSNK
jgi:hypothetical protein